MPQVRLHQNNEAGQLLIEMMVSISLLLVGILGLFTLLTQSFALEYSYSTRYIGTYLATEGVELVRHIVDANAMSGRSWVNGLPEGQFGCSFDDTAPDSSLASEPLSYDEKNGVYRYGLVMKQSPFRRSITVDSISADEIRIKSRVYWKDKGGTDQEVVIEDHLFNWR